MSSIGEPAEEPVRSLAPEVSISRSIARLLRETTGRGASESRTTIGRDHVLVMLDDPLTQQERTLVDHGYERAVVGVREAVQAIMRPEASELVAAATGREVIGFSSVNHFSPDRSIEIFLLGEEPAPVRSA